MQTGGAERRRRSDRRRRSRERTRSSEEEITRLNEVIATMQQKEKQAGEEEEGQEKEGRGRNRRREKEARSSRRAASEGGEGGEQLGSLRLRVHQLEKEKLELTSSHNQELSRLQAALTRLRSSVERGEAQRVELQYQLTVSQRDADRVAKLSREKQTLTERGEELQQTLQELQKVLEITRQAREEDQHALQQDIEERDRLIDNLSSENQRLLPLLQDQKEALQESERRMEELQKERDKEAEENRRQANEMKYLEEREERRRSEREQWAQRMRSLEEGLEAERAAHLESKFSSELLQLRGRDLEAALAAERSAQQEALSSLELLRTQFREVDRSYSLERERSCSTEHALQRLQAEFKQCKSDLSVAVETERTMTSDLTERLEEEKRRHADTHTLLEQEVRRRSAVEEHLNVIRETLQQHANEHDGKRSPSADILQLLRTTLSADRLRLETTSGQIQDLLSAAERLHEDNQSLRQLTSDQRQQIQESQQASSRLEEEVNGLRQESSDWSTQRRALQAELEKEREEREKEKEEREKEREEREKEREEREEERTAEVQRITDHYETESKARLSFLYYVYQRLLAGCVLLDQPHSVLGNFTWNELCEVINEQVDQLTSDLQKANDKIAHLQAVCEKKSVCVRELQRSQECVLSRLEESVRRREEAWNSRHTHTVTQLYNQLQVCRSQCDSLREHASSLERHASSLTSDLSRLRGLLSCSRGESASFLSACALLAGTLKHTHRRLQTLCKQKAFLSRRLAEREELEEEVRRLAGALGSEEEEEEKEKKRRRAVRRWRMSVCVVLAVRRWRALSKRTTVLFRLEMGGGDPVVSICSEVATRKGSDAAITDADDEELCARWLHSKSLSSIILSSTADLQEALALTGSSPPDVMSAARSSLSRLLDHLLDQSDAASSVGVDTLSSQLQLGLSRVTPQRPDTKVLVSSLQQHFLLFSQRLHSAEVERRGLRVEVANLKRARRQDREETCRTVPALRFHSVCVELRQALNREQETQMLIQEQTNQLQTLKRRVDAHAAEQADTQRSLSHTTQSLSEARQEVTRKERSLRILGKHLSGVQRERKQLEERARRVEDELTDATRRKDYLISNMKAAETSYKEVRESLIQSRGSLSAQPHPLPLLREHLELSGAESIMGAPEVAACQSLLSSVSQLYHTCSARIDWLEQEVSAHRSHVTALRGELQDACLRDNLAYVPVAEFPETFPLADEGTHQPVPFSDWLKEPSVSLSTAPSQTNPAPSSPLYKPLREPKTKEKRRKNRGGRR